MDQYIIDTIQILREKLHELAERSGEEKETKACLMDFLRENTSLRIDDFGLWFCAVHSESETAETVAFRADMDALPVENGAAHLCGHDGHCAVLAGLGLYLENRILGRNIVLIFQHAEENGMGGKVCCQALKEYQVSRVYAFHNIPKWPENVVLIRRDTFACASRGMTITFNGRPSHAAYPENGQNPGFTAARLISSLPEITDSSHYHGLAMATLIGAKIGEKTFGSAAGKAEVWLTLRAWSDDDLTALISNIKEKAIFEASRDGAETTVSFNAGFPATMNDNDTLARLVEICRQVHLECIEVPEPFRWSEDFGYYGADAKAVMVGVGAGLNWPQLHTEEFIFNDRIMPTVLTLFSALAELG